jgi:hypothetical protein
MSFTKTAVSPLGESAGLLKIRALVSESVAGADLYSRMFLKVEKVN